jgi:hypothetical protein
VISRSSIGGVRTRDLVHGVGRIAGWAARTGYELSKRLPGASDDEPPRLEPVPVRAKSARGDDPLRTRMARLLAESAELKRDDARDRLYEAILASLVPDEARILSTLAQGGVFPLIDVAERTLFGGVGRIVLRNASTVGKAAGVTLDDHVPVYVTRLVDLNVAEVLREDPTLDTQYEVLVADEAVVEVVNTVRRPTFVRRTLRISRFGLRLWQACDPAGG